MKLESLRTILIDREAGELAPEMIELLDSWLADHPHGQEEAQKMRETFAISEKTVRAYPALARPESNIIAVEARRWRLGPLALAASIAVLLGMSVWIATKQKMPGTRTAAWEESLSTEKNEKKIASPWAKYDLVSSPRGGLTVVRSDSSN